MAYDILEAFVLEFGGGSEAKWFYIDWLGKVVQGIWLLSEDSNDANNTSYAHHCKCVPF